MIDALAQGIGIIAQPAVLVTILFSTLIGLLAGIIPAISGITMCALLLPLVFRLPPSIALASLVALTSVTATGGSITAILVSIPGTGPNAATLFDGFPMTRKGEGSRAIAAAVVSSMAGGVLPVFLALLMIPLVIPIVMAYKSPEMCILIVAGLSLMAALTGGSVIKGLISGGLGLLAATVGAQISSATPRFTLGIMFLYDGLSLVAVALGIFALGELIDLTVKGEVSIAPRASGGRITDVWRGTRDVLHHKWLWLRSALIGYVVGLLPGAGGDVAAFMAYAQARQTSRNPEKFGTGCVEGVIAPESANNAKESGALLTTMAFGIPGSPVMALLLAGFLMVGVTPGPKMLVEHLDLALALLIGIATANLVGGCICLFAAPQLSKIATVKMTFLVPALSVLAFTGVFLATGNVANFVVMFLFGVLGFLMKRCGYSRPLLLMGLILGKLFEQYLFLSLKTLGPLFFTSPISLTMLAITIGVFVYPRLRRRSVSSPAEE